MTIFLYIGLFMLLSGTILATAGRMLFFREINANPDKQKQNLEGPRRLASVGIFGMMSGFLLIAIYLFDYYLPIA